MSNFTNVAVIIPSEVDGDDPEIKALDELFDEIYQVDSSYSMFSMATKSYRGELDRKEICDLIEKFKACFSDLPATIMVMSDNNGWYQCNSSDMSIELNHPV